MFIFFPVKINDTNNYWINKLHFEASDNIENKLINALNNNEDKYLLGDTEFFIEKCKDLETEMIGTCKCIN